MITRLYCLILVIAAFTFLSTGCNKPNEKARVTVKYKQMANFHTYNTAPNSSSGCSGGVCVMYKVTQIQNTGSEAATFTFNANSVVTVTSDKSSDESLNVGSIMLSNQNLETITVNAGQTVTVNKCFLKHAFANDPASLSGAKIPVIYKINQAQPVSMSNIAENDSPAQVGPALPSDLQNICAGN